MGGRSHKDLGSVFFGPWPVALKLKAKNNNNKIPLCSYTSNQDPLALCNMEEYECKIMCIMCPPVHPSPAPNGIRGCLQVRAILLLLPGWVVVKSDLTFIEPFLSTEQRALNKLKFLVCTGVRTGWDTLSLNENYTIIWDPETTRCWERMKLILEHYEHCWHPHL